MHADLERFKGWLKDNKEFNSQILGQLNLFKEARRTGGSKSAALSLPVLFRCELILDMIAIQDHDVVIAQFISSSYPFIEEIACEYVFVILSEEMDGVSRHSIRVAVTIQNDYFSRSLSEFRQLEMLSTQLRTRESIAGELASFSRVRILQLFPESMYSSLRIFESECTCEKGVGHCNNNNKPGRQFVIKNNLITHFCEKQGAAIGNCRMCNSPRIEDQNQRVLERYQQALVFIPCMKNVSQSKGIYTMYIQKTDNNDSALAVNAWYSCLAYYAVQPLVSAQKIISSSCLLSEYQEIQVKEYLFALRVSAETKNKNIGFAEKLLDAMNEAKLFLIQDEIGREEEEQLLQQQKKKGQQDDDFDPNFHFRFKQLAFASEVVFSAIGNQSSLSAFACLHYKMALILSYVSNNATHLLGLMSQERKNQESTGCPQNHLHVKLNCSPAFYDRVVDLVEGVFGELDDFMVFDARSDYSLLMNALIQVGSGILLIKHAGELSKGAAEVISKVLMKQPVQFDKLKTALVLPITVWSFVEVSDEFSENSQSMNGGNRKKVAGSSSSLNGVNSSLFDIILAFDKAAMSAKDYTSMLSLFAESYSTEIRMQKAMGSNQVDQEIKAGNRKNDLSKQEGYFGIMSPVRREKKGVAKRFDVVNYSTNRKQIKIMSSLENVSTEKLSRVRRESVKASSPKVLIANEVQAFELMESFVNTARANSEKRINAVYSMNNAASVAKVARTTALFTQMFVNQADADTWMIVDEMSNSDGRSNSRSQRRVGIDVFDAFIGMFFNVLSRELFNGLIDKQYLMSFLVNYGIGYQGNEDFVIPQEKEFYLAFDKIQDMIADLIDFEDAEQ